MAECLEQEQVLVQVRVYALPWQQGQEEGLGLGPGLGGEGTEREHLQWLLEVPEAGQCKVEGHSEAEVEVQAWGSLAGN